MTFWQAICSLPGPVKAGIAVVVWLMIVWLVGAVLASNNLDADDQL